MAFLDLSRMRIQNDHEVFELVHVAMQQHEMSMKQLSHQVESRAGFACQENMSKLTKSPWQADACAFASRDQECADPCWPVEFGVTQQSLEQPRCKKFRDAAICFGCLVVRANHEVLVVVQDLLDIVIIQQLPLSFSATESVEGNATCNR